MECNSYLTNYNFTVFTHAVSHFEGMEGKMIQQQRKFMDRATPNTITVGGFSEEPYEEPQERVFDAEQFKKLSHPTLALMGFKEYALLRKFQREELQFACARDEK